MPSLSDLELERLLADLESDRVERTAAWSNSTPTKAREAVCAFANDLPNHGLPGVLFLGAKDDGSPSGLKVTDKLLLTLSDIKTDGHIVPPPTMYVEKRGLRGAELAVVTVEPSDSPPVRYDGRTHIRIGPRRGIASAQDESILGEKRRHGDLPFDARRVPTGALSDLDLRAFEEEYLPAAFAPDVLSANQRTREQRLSATKMVTGPEDPTPTILGMLVLGLRTRDFVPGAYIQFLRIAGRELHDPIVDEQVCDGTTSETIRRIEDKLRAHLRTSVDLVSAPLERRSSSYPMTALEQFVRNAVLHRSYEHSNAPVKVIWFDDRIEIHSPGGPFGTVTRSNFGAPGLTEYRNPNLAEALKVLGFVQRFGVGIATANKALKENGNSPAEFLVEDTRVAVIIRGST
jgi:ATP-dependent DNA helicase RecG